MTATGNAPDVTGPTARLTAAGVSIWLDDLSRSLVQSGLLSQLVASRDVVGVTSNPTVFANAFRDKTSYWDHVSDLVGRGMDPIDIATELMTRDVAEACDVLAASYANSGGLNGRVSLELDPGLAHDEAATIEQAKRLWTKINRPNAMVKIPATIEGLAAVVEVVGSGISVNVTLLFGVARYQQTIDAYFKGLELALTRGIDVASIHSVASFFLSRVDSEVDRRLETAGASALSRLRGRIGVANARLAYQEFEAQFRSPHARQLLSVGANIQRPLWASLAPKDSSVPDTAYVEQMVAENCVITVPQATLEATHNHAAIAGDTVHAGFEDAANLIVELEEAGISLDEVVEHLEHEGLASFTRSWTALADLVEVIAAQVIQQREFSIRMRGYHGG